MSHLQSSEFSTVSPGTSPSFSLPRAGAHRVMWPLLQRRASGCDPLSVILGPLNAAPSSSGGVIPCSRPLVKRGECTGAKASCGGARGAGWVLVVGDPFIPCSAGIQADVGLFAFLSEKTCPKSNTIETSEILHTIGTSVNPAWDLTVKRSRFTLTGRRLRLCELIGVNDLKTLSSSYHCHRCICRRLFVKVIDLQQ